MRGILLVSHGVYAKGMKESIEMIVGHQEDIFFVGIEPHESSDNFLEKLACFDEKLKVYSEVIVFCDLLGGTPCNNIIKKYYLDDKFKVISGMNFPILLTAILQKEVSVKNLIEDGKAGILDVKEYCSMDDIDD